MELINFIQQLHKGAVVIEEEIELTTFKNEVETFTVYCADGFGVGINNKFTVLVEYPKMSELTYIDKRKLLDYRYFDVDSIKTSETHFGDVMLGIGKVKIIYYN